MYGSFSVHFSITSIISNASTHKQLEMHIYIITTVAADALALQHQTMSMHSADYIFILLDQLHTKILH